MSISFDSLGIERSLPSWRKALGWGYLAALMATAGSNVALASTETVAPQALGVIVKLKDGRLTSADGRGMARPSSLSPEVAQRRRLMTAQLAQRHRVSFLVQKDTVFGAQVLHRGEPTALKDAEAEAQRLRQDPEVEWAVPNEIMRPAAVGQSVPSVNSPGRFWIRSRSDVGPGVADFPAAWSYLQGSSLTPVVTAVLDSGVTFSKSNIDPTIHPDFDNRLFSGYDFVSNVAVSNDGNGRDSDASDPGDWVSSCPGDPTKCQDSSWHGTVITSMLSAPKSSSGSGVEMGPGIFAPIDGQPVVLPIRVGGTGGASSIDIIEAMYWAAGLSSVNGTPNNHPARVISLSYGATSDCQGGSGTVDALYRNAIAVLRSFGVVVVASAGNGNGSGLTGYATPSMPASCQGVIASTGLRGDASKAAYANLVNGTRVSQCYFGVAVVSGDSDVGETLETLGNTGTTTPLLTTKVTGIEGTSFAAPQVAGVAALMLAVNPALSSVDVAHRIMQSATTFPLSGTACGTGNLGNCRCTPETCGAGVLDARAALVLANNPPLFGEGVCPSADVRASSSGGGGGGGSSDVSLLVLLAALASWMLGAALWQRLRANDEARRLVRHAITNGKR